MGQVIIKAVVTVITFLMVYGVPVTSSVNSGAAGGTAGNMQNSGYAAASEEWIYYYSEGNMCRTQEGNDESNVLIEDINSFLADPFWGNMNIVDEWIYFKTMHGSVYKVTTGGGELQPVMIGETDPYMVGVCEFLIVDGWLYYNYELTNPGRMERSSVIRRMRLDGSDEQALVGEDNSDMLWLDDVADGYIYYHGIRHNEERFFNYRIPVEGGEPERIDFIPYAAQMQVADGWLYYCDSSDSLSICRVRTDGSKAQVLYDQGYCNNINVAGDWIYCLVSREKDDYENRYYMRIRTDGTNMQILSEEGVMHAAVVGDVVCSMLYGTMRVRGTGNDVYLDRVSAGVLNR